MRNYFLAFLIITISACKPSQQSTTVVNLDTVHVVSSPEPVLYRAAYTRHHDLIHTKLDLRFNWTKKYVNGKAIISLHPHFYPTDSLTINARGMDIHEIRLLNSPITQFNISEKNSSLLKYAYDSLLLHIKLDRTYKKEDTLNIYIAYTGKPDELPSGGSAAITRDKGLYFINPDNSDPENKRPRLRSVRIFSFSLIRR